MADDGALRVAPAGATILIVDDIAANARLLERLLAREGHRVLFAHDGEEALERVRHDHPDLVLMDVIMPTLDGFETCRRLKSDPETAPGSRRARSRPCRAVAIAFAASKSAPTIF